MKTKDRILVAALEMFNELGIANLAALDIANELDISPGNLYYHYKGKTEILQTLLDRYEKTLQQAFRQPLAQIDQPEEGWLFLYALLELMYEYRFLFRSVADISESYPEVERVIHRILLVKLNILTDILSSIAKDEQSEETPLPLDVVMVLILNWFNYRALAGSEEGMQELVYSAMVRLETLLAPYCSIDMRGYMRLCNDNYASKM